MWDETWTPADINDSDFGVVYSVSEPENPSQSHYLKATNFGFTIPINATIDGIEIKIENHRITAMGRDKAFVDVIEIIVYYTT